MSDLDDALRVLRHEFHAEEGSFLLVLRSELRWDRVAFGRLERAMRVVCAATRTEDRLDRWVAAGFHEVATGVPAWTGHPRFPRPEPESYHQECLERLTDLADWYFRGWHAYLEPHEWTDL